MGFRKVLASVALFVCLCGILFWALSGSEDRAPEVASDETTSREEKIQQASESVPEYLAFRSVIDAGEIYKVADSSETEYLAEDSDNEIDELDEELAEEIAEDELEDLLDEYDLEIEDADLTALERVEPISIGNSRRTIEPGIYVTPIDAQDCSYELRRIMADGTLGVVGSDSLAEGRLIVNINGVEPDYFYSSEGCREWSEWTELSEPLEVVGDGDYWIDDLAIGEWEPGIGCRWERVRDFRGAVLDDVLDSGNEEDLFAVTEGMTGFRVRNCLQPMVLIDDAVPETLAYVDQTHEPIEQRRTTRRR